MLQKCNSVTESLVVRPKYVKSQLSKNEVYKIYLKPCKKGGLQKMYK